VVIRNSETEESIPRNGAGYISGYGEREWRTYVNTKSQNENKKRVGYKKLGP
jgi:hypothetical protein